MEVKPYEKKSIRSKRFWSELADHTGLNEVTLREAFIDGWFTSCEPGDFGGLVLSGKITREQLIGHAGRVLQMSAEEIIEKQDEWEKAKEEDNHCDLMHYQLKQLVQVGDQWMCDESKTFLSGPEYVTSGQLYRINELSDYRDGLVGFTMITATNMPEERNWGSHYSVNSLWRDGKEIWNWQLAYYASFAEFHPTCPADSLEELRVHCEAKATLTRQGKKSH